ncbi:BapA prefix-like domain-containing protein [Citrobacter sedlakii]
MRLLAVVSKLTGVSTNVEASEVTLNTPSIVKLSAQREEISQLARVNQDLVITFHSGEKVTIKNFYVTNDQGASQLVLEDDNGALWWVENPEAGLQFEQISSIDELLITAGGANEGAAIWPWVLGGVVAAGGIAAIAASGGGGGDDDDDNGSGNPGGGTDNGGGGTTTPPPGSVDTTPPASPLITSALDAVAGITGAIQNGQTTNDNQPVLSGTGEVGAVITVYDNGQVLGTTTVDASGNWSFKPPSSLADGEHELTVTATDKAGNTSIVSGDFTFVVDTQAPGAITDLAISADGLVISGNAEADSTVTITNSDGTTLGTVTADSNGKFTLTLTQALQNGEVLTAIAMDKAGNSGPSGTVTAPDSTPPQPAGNLDVSDDGTTVTGTAEPGSTITIRDPAGNSIGQGKTDDQGNFNVVLDTPQTNGETVTVVVTDTANLTSPPATAVAPDTTPPQPAGNLDVSDDGTTVTGTAEPGSTITIRDPDGNPVGEGVTDEQGNFSVDLNTPQKNGETLAVTATDGSNNTSQPANVQAPDITAPQAPVVVSIVDDAGDVKGDLTAGQSTDDNQLIFSGTGEPGATITILDGGTALPGSVIVGSDGTWTLTTPVLEDGNHNFTVTATDANNQTSTPSPSVTLTVDTSAPDAPFITSPTTPAATNQPELPIIGTGEPGSTVTLSDGNTVVGTAVVDGDGNWTITPAPALTEGSYTLTAVATDPAGNQSQPSAPIVLEVDTTPPATPESVVISQDGGTVTGTAETGSTVIIRDADGNIIGSGVATDGTFSIAITPAQTGNAGLTATAQDTAGNTSPAANFNGSGSGLPVISAVVDDEGSVLGDLRSGQTTDDTLPGLRGTATPDSTLNVLVDGVNVGTVTVDGTGSWVWTATAALGEGTHTFQVVDSANAENASAVVNITVDLTAPVQPVIGSVTDDVAPGTGTLASGDTTNDSRPALSGTGTDGETISIYDGATLLGQVQVENGVWNFTPPTALGEGSHSLTITATDAAGNISAPSAAFEVVVDTTAPLVPAITSATDDSDPQTSIISDGGSTNDTTPTFSGSGENGSIVTIFDNGVRIGTATVTNGSWSFTPSTLSDGTHSITVTATDATGNISAPSGTYTITVDTIPPQPAGNLDVSDDGVTVTGTAEAGATVTIYGSDSAPLGSAVVQDDGTFTVTLNTPQTNGQIVTAIVTDPANQESTPASVTAPDTTPPQPAGNLDVSGDGATVTGTAEAGTSVTIYASDNTPLGSALVQPDGTFTVTLNTPQTNGEILTAIVTDPANLTSSPATTTAPDTTAPLAAANLDVSDDGATVTGTAEAGTTVTIYASDNTPLGSALVQPDGSFTVTLDTPQTNGEILTAVVTDTVNLTSPPSTTIAPDITPPQPAGNLNVSDDGATVTGTAEPGSTVTIRDPDGNPLGQGTTDDQGNFSVDLDTPQTNGETLTAVVTDPANQESTPASVTAPDTTAPLPPSNVEVSGDGSSLTATAEPGSRITVKDSEGNTLAVSEPVPANGTVTVSLTPAVVNGETLTVTATDGSNNTSQPTSVQAPDITAPEAPVVVSIADDFGGVNGNLDTGQSTDDNRLTFSGTGEPGATITILNGGVPLSGTTIVDPDGNWTLTTDVLPDGEYTFTATATDGQDQTSPASDAVVITVDTTAPTAPVLTITDNTGEITGELTNNAVTDATQPVLSGSGTAGDIITVYDGTTAIGTTEVTNAGTWSFTPAPALSEGSHILSVTASDPLGNTSANSAAIVITVDTTAPATPALTVADGDDAPLSNGQATNETQPVLSGTGVNGERVTIYDKGVEVAIGSVVVSANGTWSFTPTTALSNGPHTLSVSAADTAGNVGPSSSFSLTVDTQTPAAPVITTILDDVSNNTGAVGSGQSTNDTLPELRGISEPGAFINIYDGATLLTPTPIQADANGAWSFTPTTALGEGSHSFTAQATDAAGNVSPASAISTIVVDTTPPAAPANLAVVANGTSVTGTAEAGSTITITGSNGTVLGTGVADGSGNFSIVITPAQVGGETLQVVAQDRAGNIGTAGSVEAPFTGLPGAPVIVSLTDEVGSITGLVANGQATNDATPLINGTAQPSSTITIYSDGVAIGTTTANAQGSWSFTPPADIADGAHALTATATNANGTGTFSSTFNVTIDTVTAAPTGSISADGASISGTAEAGSTVTITLSTGETLTTTANSSGNYTLTFDRKQTSGENISVSATDAVGNVSTTTQVQAPTLPIAASDNVENLTITTDATVTTNDYSDYGLLLVGALGNVANVLGNDTAAVEFTVQDGGSANLVIDASTTGVVLSLLNTQEVAIQKYDAATNSWTTVIDTAQAQFANLLTLGSSGVTVNVTGLEGGTYRVLTYNTALLATGSYTALNVNVEQTSAGTITSAETQTGNVLNNDSAPQDTVVTTVTSTNGNSVTLGSGSSVLQGVYGTLTINPDGSYSYALNPNSPASVVGRTESFTYTITGGGNTTSAKLVITLGNETPASSVTAVDNVATLPYDTLVDAVNNGPSSQGGFTVVNVSLGNVLDVGVLDRLSYPIIFDVEEGTTRTMTLQSSIGGVAVASSFDLYIYRFNDVTQQFEQWRVERNWLNAPLLGGQSNPLTLNLPGGEYLFLLNPSFGITALTGYTLNILEDHVYSVESLSTTTQGNVLNDDVAPDGTLVTQVNGVAVAQTGTTTIVGAWGTLTIDAQGNYTYTLKSGLGADSTSTPDSFVYTVRAPNGDTDTASLNIQPTARALDAVNDVSDTLIAPSVQDTVSYLDSSVGTASWGAFGRTGSGSGTFDVAAGTILKGAAIVFNVSTLITLGNLTITWTVLENGVVIRTGTVPVSNITLGGATVTVNLTGLELDGGTYTLNFTGNNTLVGAATITPRITGTTVDLDNFETSGTHTVNGNIFDGSDASGVLDQLNTVDTRLTVTGFNGSTATLDPYSSGTTTIQGQYGSLQIRADGSYTYTLNNGVALSSMSTKETFTYKLDDTRGHTDTATLTVDIAPQVVSTTQNDVLVGSAYGDTLIYNLLNASSATGGNGTDTWRNFSLTQSDKIDIGDLLVGWNGDNATLGSYLNVSTSGGNTTISIDRDGAGSTYQSTALVTLENVQTTLNELIEQNHIVT